MQTRTTETVAPKLIDIADTGTAYRAYRVHFTPSPGKSPDYLFASNSSGQASRCWLEDYGQHSLTNALLLGANVFLVGNSEPRRISMEKGYLLRGAANAGLTLELTRGVITPTAGGAILEGHLIDVVQRDGEDITSPDAPAFTDPFGQL